jgi:hypothetical protein
VLPGWDINFARNSFPKADSDAGTLATKEQTVSNLRKMKLLFVACLLLSTFAASALDSVKARNGETSLRGYMMSKARF